MDWRVNKEINLSQLLASLTFLAAVILAFADARQVNAVQDVRITSLEVQINTLKIDIQESLKGLREEIKDLRQDIRTNK